MKYTYTSLLLLMGLCLHAQTVSLTLEECRAKALEYNKELQNAKTKTQEAAQYRKAAKTAYLPSAKVEANAIHLMGIDDIAMQGGFLPTATSEEAAIAGQYSGLSNVYSPGMSVELGDLSILYGGISVSQPLYTGGKIMAANKQAQTGVEMSELSYELKRSQVIEMADEAFWTIVSVSSSIKLANEYITMLTELEQKMDEMHAVGIVPASEKLKVSVKKNEAEFNLMRAQNGLKLATMRLNQVLGQDLNAGIELEYNDSLAVEMPDVSGATESAQQNREEIKLMEKKVDMSRCDKQVAVADYLPTVGVGFQYTGTYIDNFTDDFTFNPMLAAKVSIPIFSWGQGHYKRQAAELKIIEAQTEFSNATDLINLEVLSVQVKLEEAYQSVIIAEKNLKEAKESLDETQASFDVGLNTITDVLNAQADWQKACSSLLQAKAQFRIAETNWKRTIGIL